MLNPHFRTKTYNSQIIANTTPVSSRMCLYFIYLNLSIIRPNCKSPIEFGKLRFYCNSTLATEYKI